MKTRGSLIFHVFQGLPLVSAVTGTMIRNDFPVHVHGSLCLGSSLKGERIIMACGHETRIHEGRLFLIPAKMAHACSTDTGKDHSYRIIAIKPQFIDQVRMDMGLGTKSATSFQVSEIEDDFLMELMEEFFSFIDEGEDLLRLSETAYEIVSRLIARHALTREDAVVSVSGETSVIKAAGYMDANWDRQILLEELGKEAGMSQYHLLRLFRRVMGITPHAYLLQTRIKKAVQLLSENTPPAEVAALAGFTDQSHFTKVFRKQVGVTPGLFQEMNSIRPLP